LDAIYCARWVRFGCNSTAYPKAKVEGVIIDSLRPIEDHIAKIFVHAPSNWDKKWEDDIATFLPRIIRIVRKVDKIGKLKASSLQKLLDDSFDLASGDVGKTYRMDKFRNLKKSGSQKLLERVADDLLLTALRSESKKLANMILSDEADHYAIAHELVKAVIHARGKIDTIE
jgi:hypothetical protein